MRSEGTFPLNVFSFGKLSTQQKKRGQEIIHEGWELSPTKMECPIVWEAHAACSFPPGSEFSLPLPNSVLFLFNMSGGLCCVGWVFFCVCVCALASNCQFPWPQALPRFGVLLFVDRALPLAHLKALLFPASCRHTESCCRDGEGWVQGSASPSHRASFLFLLHRREER